jgi:hypothetical protein
MEVLDVSDRVDGARGTHLKIDTSQPPSPTSATLKNSRISPTDDTSMSFKIERGDIRAPTPQIPLPASSGLTRTGSGLSRTGSGLSRSSSGISPPKAGAGISPPRNIIPAYSPSKAAVVNSMDGIAALKDNQDLRGKDLGGCEKVEATYTEEILDSAGYQRMRTNSEIFQNRKEGVSPSPAVNPVEDRISKLMWIVNSGRAVEEASSVPNIYKY